MAIVLIQPIVCFRLMFLEVVAEPMIGIVKELLSKQDPSRPHTLLTRLTVSSCICFAFIVLYGFYGLIAAVVVYLFGVELMGLPTKWMYYPFVIGLLLGCWHSVRGIRDYWRNYGNADSRRTD